MLMLDKVTPLQRSMTEAEAIELLTSQGELTMDQLCQMRLYLDLHAPMPLWLANRLQILLLAQLAPPTEARH